MFSPEGGEPKDQELPRGVDAGCISALKPHWPWLSRNHPSFAQPHGISSNCDAPLPPLIDSSTNLRMLSSSVYVSMRREAFSPTVHNSRHALQKNLPCPGCQAKFQRNPGLGGKLPTNWACAGHGLSCSLSCVQEAPPYCTWK